MFGYVVMPEHIHLLINRYAYVLDNPLTFVDPLGLNCDDDVGTYESITEDADGNATAVVSGGCSIGYYVGGGFGNPGSGGGGGRAGGPHLNPPQEPRKGVPYISILRCGTHNSPNLTPKPATQVPHSSLLLA